VNTNSSTSVAGGFKKRKLKDNPNLRKRKLDEETDPNKSNSNDAKTAVVGPTAPKTGQSHSHEGCGHNHDHDPNQQCDHNHNHDHSHSHHHEPAPEKVDEKESIENESEEEDTSLGGALRRRLKRRRKEALNTATTARATRQTTLDPSYVAAGTVIPTNDPHIAVDTATDRTIRNEKTINKPKWQLGPLRAPSNVRAYSRMDYQPDVCKDYKETGYCGFGDSCKFVHDRGDYKAGWQLEREWKLEQEMRTRKMLGEEVEQEQDYTIKREDDLPFACWICKEEFKNPVVTKCNHYFCEKCALDHYVKDSKCAACGEPTQGIFNTATRLLRLRVSEGKDYSVLEKEAAALAEAKAQAAQRDDADAAELLQLQQAVTRRVASVNAAGVPIAPPLAPPTSSSSARPPNL